MKAGEEQSDVEALRITREESRAVLDHHLTLLNDLDDKAMWTVRTAILLLALLASTAAIGGIAAVANLSSSAKFSFILAIIGLFVTIFVGHVAYVVSTTKLGPGKSHRRTVRVARYSEREWLNIYHPRGIRRVDPGDESNE